MMRMKIVEKNKLFTENDIRNALKESIIEFNKDVLHGRSDTERIMINKLLLDFVGRMLGKLNLFIMKYKLKGK